MPSTVRANTSLTDSKKFDSRGRNHVNCSEGTPMNGRRIQPIWAPTSANTTIQMANTARTFPVVVSPGMRSMAPGRGDRQEGDGGEPACDEKGGGGGGGSSDSPSGGATAGNSRA